MNKGEEPGVEEKHEDEPEEPNGQEDVVRSDFLLDHVEFRKKVYVHSKDTMDWVSDTQKEDGSLGKRPFRYDIDERAKLIFSISKSAALYGTFRELCPPAHDRGVQITNDALEIKGEFSLLHCREELKRLGNDADTKEDVKKELRVMEMLYMRNGQLSNAQRRYEALLQNQKIDTGSLQGLFHKDQLVVFRELRDEWAVARVKTITAYDEDILYLNRKGWPLVMQLECEAIEFDGKTIRNHMYRQDIEQFSGTRNITELPVYPLEFNRDKERIIKDSIESGKRWEKLHSQLTADGQPKAKVMQYSGYCEMWDYDSDDEEGSNGREVCFTLFEAYFCYC